MAREYSERAHRLEQYPRRGEHERDRRERGQEERPYYGRRELDDDETRPTERRHWRGHDYDDDDEFERGRSYHADDRDHERLLGSERPRSFLRGREDDERYARRDELRPYRWGGREAYRDDDRGVGPYIGRGPKGYRRSDDRILEEICERLTDHPSIDASDIEVRVADGDVTLTGQVESRTVKHLTENMVETVSGVKEVHNQLRITPPANLADDWQEPRERHSADPGASKTRRR
jgi:hypothetical protein